MFICLAITLTLSIRFRLVLVREAELFLFNSKLEYKEIFSISYPDCLLLHFYCWNFITEHWTFVGPGVTQAQDITDNLILKRLNLQRGHSLGWQVRLTRREKSKLQNRRAFLLLGFSVQFVDFGKELWVLYLGVLFTGLFKQIPLFFWTTCMYRLIGYRV